MAEAAKMGFLDDYMGHGGVKPFPHPNDEPLVILLDHSDCDGEIEAADTGKLADRLEQLLPDVITGQSGDMQKWLTEVTERFIKGLRKAAKKKQRVRFQ